MNNYFWGMLLSVVGIGVLQFFDVSAKFSYLLLAVAIILGILGYKEKFSK